MSDESTPLTSAMPHGPIYSMAGSVPSVARRRKMMQLQYCICMSLIGGLFAALLVALLVGNIWSPVPATLLSVDNNQANDVGSNNATTLALVALATDVVLPDQPDAGWALADRNVSRAAMDAAISWGIKALGDKEILEEGSATTPFNSPAFRHYRALNTNVEARKLARRGYVENQATLRLAAALNYTRAPPEAGGGGNIGRGPDLPMRDPTLRFACNFNAHYRYANGLCNSRTHPRYYGAALTPYRRMVAPDYADGIAMPRSSAVPNTTLPPARQVSLQIHRPAYDTDASFTVMLAVFGQFLDHDITATSSSSLQEGESIDCCTRPPNPHPDCFPVSIAADDPFYERYNVTCMNFVRSAAAPVGHFGPRQQLNQATAFIDASVVYGNSEHRQRQLRSESNGTLRMFVTDDGRELLPISTNPYDGCNRVQMTRDGLYCFESGDERANENLLLTSMHLVFARHHNYLARNLQRLNAHWDDELLFQEARRILGAQMAHIAYNEFLPILLGRKLAASKGLLPRHHADDHDDDDDDNADEDTYDPEVDPSVANSFASAAFRFAHTLLPGLFNITRDNETREVVALHKMLFNPFSLWAEGGVDEAVLAAVQTPVLRVNRFFSLEVTEKLFEGRPEDRRPRCGLDLVSLNIQRGRDHGLPSYPHFRRHCHLSSVDTWTEMASAIDPASLQSIMAIYASPHDVDVYTGALSEPPLKGAIFGPLLTCLVSDQFLRLKRGDSHWYERRRGQQQFTANQLKAIYNTTLAAIICRNADSLQRTQRHVMEHERPDVNELVNCSDIASFDFTPWKDDGQGWSRLHRVRVAQPAVKVRTMHRHTNRTTGAGETRTRNSTNSMEGS